MGLGIMRLRAKGGEESQQVFLCNAAVASKKLFERSPLCDGM
jgi:hypothetical protein